MGLYLCEKLEPWSVGEICISRGENLAKILRWQKMLPFPQKGRDMIILAEAGGLVRVPEIGE